MCEKSVMNRLALEDEGRQTIVISGRGLDLDDDLVTDSKEAPRGRFMAALPTEPRMITPMPLQL